MEKLSYSPNFNLCYFIKKYNLKIIDFFKKIYLINDHSNIFICHSLY